MVLEMPKWCRKTMGDVTMMVMMKNARCNTEKQTVYNSPSTSVAIHSCLTQDRYDARQVLLSMRCDLAL
jgi:hypothetical protein